MGWKSYKELIVWQKAMCLTDEVYALARRLPKEETYALSDQMRRAVVSVPSNIAEGQGRQTANEFRQFLAVARGSCAELNTQLLIGVRQRYFKDEEIEMALLLCDEIGRMLTSMIAQLMK